MKTAQNTGAIKPSAADEAQIYFVDYGRLALKPGERQRPRWIREEGLCLVGCWERLPWRRHSGGATTWAEEDYAFEHSQTFLDDIKKLGCNLVVVPYDCGHGEAFIEDDVQMSKAFIELAHQNGLKVGTYFRPDIVWIETLSDEELAELEGGFQRDSAGRFIQPFGSSARNVCYHHPGGLARFKRYIRRAIVELKTDMLHLDGLIIGGYEGAGACRCLLCVADFRRFLLERYGQNRELAKRRFGHPFLERIVPPANYPTDAPPYDSGPIQSHWCEWVAFRCSWTTRVLAEIAAFAQELNPEAAINTNTAVPAVRENAALLMGADVIGADYADAQWCEDAYGPALLKNGLLIQRVRQCKLCRASRTVALTYMHEQEERPLRQNLAHVAAFNDGAIGCIGFPPHMNFSNRYTVHFQVKCKFMRWFNAHRDYYRQTRSAARIALWRPRENMAMSGKLTYAAAMRMEQLLIETCRGFDIVLEETPAALSRYDLVITPNVECMSLTQIEGLIAYVKNGGSLFVGQDSALFDLWHRRRIENPWAALFGTASARNVVADAVADGFAGIFVAADAKNARSELTRATHGKGRAVYAPMVVDPTSQPSMVTSLGEPNLSLDYTNWVVPRRAEQFKRAIDWLMKEREPIRVSAQRGMLAEFLAQEASNRRLVHLVNLRPRSQRGCRVKFRFAVEKPNIRILSPPTDISPRWRFQRGKAGAQVIFDLLDTYAVVVLEKNPEKL
ncbi:MAG: hypothetical protein HY360_18100 [Verrucomicrobia bacterium]|nr:hypothetical protein [Verrucomicrobiota bacterium]